MRGAGAMRHTQCMPPQPARQLARVDAVQRTVFLKAAIWALLSGASIPMPRTPRAPCRRSIRCRRIATLRIRLRCAWRATDKPPVGSTSVFTALLRRAAYGARARFTVLVHRQDHQHAEVPLISYSACPCLGSSVLTLSEPPIACTHQRPTKGQHLRVRSSSLEDVHISTIQPTRIA
jgi:hypothetical protein